MTTMTTSK